MSSLKLIETNLNIFHAPQTYSLAHAVSADFHSVKGTLAWQFALIFGHVDDGEMGNQSIDVGNVAVLESNTRIIYFLVTKENIHEHSTYQTLEAALICMREHMRKHAINKVAMPKICCGNDKLDWLKVKDIIYKIFAKEIGIEILICVQNTKVLNTPRCEIVDVKGNVLNAPPNFSIVHSISADLAMCKGVNLQFKCKFGSLNEVTKNSKHIGNVAVLKDHDRYIYNLILKERHHEKCTFPALYYALIAMRDHMLEHNVTKLAIPKFGCSIDRLDWLRVKKMLEFVFNDDKVEIIAYFYDPPVVMSRRSMSMQSLNSKRSY